MQRAEWSELDDPIIDKGCDSLIENGVKDCFPAIFRPATGRVQCGAHRRGSLRLGPTPAPDAGHRRTPFIWVGSTNLPLRVGWVGQQPQGSARLHSTWFS